MKALPKLSPAKAAGLEKKLARLAARAWVKGRPRLAALGLDIQRGVHAKALEAAEASVDDEEGGFLDDARKAIANDEMFVTFAKALARAYAKAVAKKKEEAAQAKEPSDVAPVEELEPEPAAPPGAISESGDGEDEDLPTLEVPDEDDAPARPLGIRMEEEPAPVAKKKPARPAEDAPLALADEMLPDAEEDAPLQVRMDEDEPPKPKGKPAKADGPSAAGPLVKRGKNEAVRYSLDDEPEIEALPTEPDGPTPEVVATPADKDEGPDAAAARALERFRKDGDTEELGSARKLFKLAAEAAPKGPARAAARAGIALAYLLEGREEDAKKHAEKALTEDPRCALGISVLSRAKRGEGARERLRSGINRARAAIRSGDAKAAGKELTALAEAFPKEPAPRLLAVALAREDGSDLQTPIQEAWRVYPSPTAPDLAFGEGTDVAIARAASQWGAQIVERDGVDALIQTQRKLEEKDNVLAGAFQIALGVARTAIATRTDLKKDEEQELRVAAAEALLGLQCYDAAIAAFEKANGVDRNSGLAMECKKGVERASVLRRSFDKPGVKMRPGAFEGVGAAALKKAIGARVATAMGEKEQEEKGLFAEEVAAVKALAQDAARRAKVENAAKKAKAENPLTALSNVEKQLEELQVQGKDLDKEPAEKKGFFGRALDKVKDTAKGAQLAVQRKVLESRRDETYRAVAKALRDVPDGGWGDAAIDALAERGRTVEARVEHLDDELLQAKKMVAKLGEL